MADRYPNQPHRRTVSYGANNLSVALSDTEVAKVFRGDTRSDIGSEAENKSSERYQRPVGALPPARLRRRTRLGYAHHGSDSRCCGCIRSISALSKSASASYCWTYLRTNYANCTRQDSFTATFCAHPTNPANATTTSFSPTGAYG